MKKVLFRCDSSSTIGTGHVMRDLVLASQFKGARVSFATQDLDGNINHVIEKAGYTCLNLKSNSLKGPLLHIVLQSLLSPHHQL